MMQQALAVILLLLGLGQAGIMQTVSDLSLGGNLYLVNRTYRLTQEYAPNDLVTPKVKRLGSGVDMRIEAAAHLEEMFAAAKADGMTLVAISGFRSFGRQSAIYGRKQKSAGKEAATLLVAPPGASEHQLGLAMDIGRVSNQNLNGSFGRSKEGQWVKENAHLFGFIVRYQEEYTEVTGYAYEPWHLRFVGKAHAQAIKNLDLPLETYVTLLAKRQFPHLMAEGKNQ